MFFQQNTGKKCSTYIHADGSMIEITINFIVNIQIKNSRNGHVFVHWVPLNIKHKFSINSKKYLGIRKSKRTCFEAEGIATLFWGSVSFKKITMIYSKQSHKGVYSILYGIIDNLISHFSECEGCHQAFTHSNPIPIMSNMILLFNIRGGQITYFLCSSKKFKKFK